MKPKYLKSNSKLYLVAPSFGCTTSPYEERLVKSISTLNNLGYSITLGENCYKDEGIAASNTPSLRAKEFMDAYTSNADAIISVGGGEMMIEILQHLNFEEIKKLPPKWFMGFSDNTVLTYTLTTLCDIQTIYGVNATRFYTSPLMCDANDALKMLHGCKSFKGYPKFELNELKEERPFNTINFDTNKIITPYMYKEPFKGILLGGCLDVLINLCGTKYDNTKNYIESNKEKGIIFYFEACDLNPLSFRRALIQLKNAGWFKHIKGFLIGRSYHYGEEIFGVTAESSVIDILGDLNVPILINVDLGHLKPSLPMKNGAIATITYDKTNIKIEYED